MSDISAIRVAVPMAQASGKNLPDADRQAEGARTAEGNNLPAAEKTPESVNATNAVDKVTAEQDAATGQAVDSKALSEAVETANDFVQSVQRDLHFSIDEDTSRTVVKVVESSSGDVIRQIPDETFLELARKMKEHGEVNLVDATG